MLKELLNEKKLPALKSKSEMLEILQREEYGYMPPKPDKITFDVTENFIPSFCAGKAISRKIDITSYIGDDKFTFPVYVSIPSKEGKHPFFVCINFRDDVVDRYIPVEEIIDNGFAVLSFCYKDVTSDDGDFTNGLAGVLYKGKERNATDCGKIAMWAWAAQRAMDYACTLDCLDQECTVVCGHSRLGKTALLTSATDERFKFAHSNDSGCSGAAITRGKVGENVFEICKRFPYWFCENYKKYIDKEYDMPFDQHYLVASIAPRYAYISSAVEDTWADPDAEMLTLVASGKAYEDLGLKGFICDDRLPKTGDEYHDGCLGYHLREGKHYFSREDWLKLIKFINKHNKKEQ